MGTRARRNGYVEWVRGTLKAHVGSLTAVSLVYLTSTRDGHLSEGDVHLMIGAALAGFGIVWAAPNKGAPMQPSTEKMV